MALIKKDILSVLANEIAFHKALAKEVVESEATKMFQKGFIKGLEQAVFLVKNMKGPDV